MQTYIIVAVIAYLLGSIPFGYILVRLFRKEDIRKTGSGNIGATNVARSGAKGLGIATLILDAAKGYVAAYLSMHPDRFGLFNDGAMFQNWADNFNYVVAAAVVFAILGHMFPVWLKFKGGKGVATGVGVFLAIAPKSVALVLMLFVAIVWVSRYVSLGSIVATATFPLFSLLLYRNWSSVVLTAMVIAVFLIIAKHHQNIRRLLAGTEHRLGEKKQTEVSA